MRFFIFLKSAIPSGKNGKSISQICYYIFLALYDFYGNRKGNCLWEKTGFGITCLVL